MRKSLTMPEAMLWRVLKRLRAEGYHFRRQVPFRGYYLDFVCFSRRLVVEVDGEMHSVEERARHDAVRDRVLAREGFRTLRLPSMAVIGGLDLALLRIREALEQQSPSPRWGRCRGATDGEVGGASGE